MKVVPLQSLEQVQRVLEHVNAELAQVKSLNQQLQTDNTNLTLIVKKMVEELATERAQRAALQAKLDAVKAFEAAQWERPR